MTNTTKIAKISQVKEHFSGELDKLHLLQELDRLVLKEQIGNCCKPLAVYHTLLLKTIQDNLGKKNQRKPDAEFIYRFAAPFYSHERNSTFKRPILSQAKRMGSVVGEMYSQKQITNLMEANGIPCVGTSEENPDTYIQSLIEQVNAGFPAIVFFDVDDQGAPGKFGSKREHAAVVVGHGVKEGQDYFVLAHWGKYHVVDAKELAESAFQLQEQRTLETFYQVHLGGKEPWLTIDDLVHRKKYFRSSLKEYDIAITAHEINLIQVQEALNLAETNLSLAEFLDAETLDYNIQIKCTYPEYIYGLRDHIEGLKTERKSLLKLLQEIPTNTGDLPMRRATVTDGGLRGVIIHTMPSLEYEHLEKIDVDKENELTQVSITRRQSF